MADQFTEFKKCITWSKSQNAWCGTFAVERTSTCKGICYSVQGAPDFSARIVKPEVAERLYARVKEFCMINDLDLNFIISQKLLAKPKRKK